MKSICKLYLIVFSLIYSQYASSGWSSYGEVTSVTSHNGLHLLHTTIQDSTCDGRGKFWWPTDDTDAKDMLSISLAALMSGKRVRLVHDNQNLQCRLGNQFNMATHIEIVHD
ncbi:hypothetical protein [Alteromonas sp. ASW11-130]|uniref:hypothetical protein n=1 Tax=Alteromonas sp. ASW11-130 TaxID=3015775 RepID=UPI00224232E8|nr:hypothetical protein [Alteromonas sp. ASW11-130]MCW8091871.1 hypothetical protein [Alteromonas sp. ASW11-130]